MTAPTIIGPATLYLGDAYAIRPTLGWMDADMFDPPYVISASGGGKWRSARPGFDQIEDQGLHTGFDLSIINPLLCGAAVVFASNEQLAELLAHVKGNFHRDALCVWQKVNPQPMANKSYRTDCEFYVHAWQRGHHPAGDVGEKLRVRRFASPRGADRFGHPTCKPLPLMDSIIANLSGHSVAIPSWAPAPPASPPCALASASMGSSITPSTSPPPCAASPRNGRESKTRPRDQTRYHPAGRYCPRIARRGRSCARIAGGD